MAEPEVSPELIEELKARDETYANVALMIDIEAELQNSKLLAIVFGMAGRQKASALAELATVDPSDTKRIVHLQAMVYRADFITSIRDEIMTAGRVAEASLTDERRDFQALHDEQETGELHG